mmetsp:Transcript_14905/g.25393  ORF Transcript_14905/g.25393 Transcript_14905/m.25393 type:complete len:148 (-) Transcript_14905:335-778(-)
MIKGREKDTGKIFLKLGREFKEKIEQLEAIQVFVHQYPDNLKRETIQNIIETMIYERIGAYLRRQLIKNYIVEENSFIEKCVQLDSLFQRDIVAFNQLNHSDFKPNFKPRKSMKILRLLLAKSQLPYEMFYIMGNVLQMVVSELSQH